MGPCAGAEARLTNIFAIKCADGIVMCADTQSTGMGKEFVAKIIPLGNCALLGCAGYDHNISLFEGIVERNISESTKDYERALVESNREYKKEVYADWQAGEGRKGESLPDNYYTEALACISDMRYGLHLFKHIAPSRPHEIKRFPYRASIGTGGYISSFIFKTIEDRVFSSVGMSWRDVRLVEVGQLAALVVFSVGNYDTYSNALADIWYLSTVDRRPHQFTSEELGFRNGRVLPAFVKGIIASHPQQLKRWLGQYADDEMIGSLLQLLSPS